MSQLVHKHREGENTQFAFSSLKVKNSVTAYIQAETMSLTASQPHTHTHTESQYLTAILTNFLQNESYILQFMYRLQVGYIPFWTV